MAKTDRVIRFGKVAVEQKPGQVMSARRLIKFLVEEEFPMPERCYDIAIQIGADGAMRIQYEAFLTDYDLIKLGRALQRCGEDA